MKPSDKLVPDDGDPGNLAEVQPLIPRHLPEFRSQTAETEVIKQVRESPWRVARSDGVACGHAFVSP